ncbi:MAG: hypothetical protein GXX08_07825 [Firmicutes bacterium]|nr:hypothetical protein [Bacillota bacterium]
MGFPLMKFLFRKPNTDRTAGSQSETSESVATYIRVAVYDSMTSIPRIVDIDASDITELIAKTSDCVYAECKKNGGEIPFVVIREVIENLIHADFKDSVVSISPDGKEILVSDHGPGIIDKCNAFLPGYTTATVQTRRYIKGVGSGLPVAKETMEVLGGSIKVDDNLGTGAVVKISLPQRHSKREESGRERALGSGRHSADVTTSAESMDAVRKKQGSGSSDRGGSRTAAAESATTRDIVRSSLSERQRRLLILAAELGEIGPSIASKELDMSLSTVYRDLVALEELHLLQSTDSGKRRLTDQGIEFLGFLMD